jgi:hypothetical protein
VRAAIMPSHLLMNQAAKPLLEIFGPYSAISQRPRKHGCLQEPFLAIDISEVASLLFSPELREGTGPMDLPSPAEGKWIESSTRSTSDFDVL